MSFMRHILVLTTSMSTLPGCHPPSEPDGLAAGLYAEGATGVGNPGSREQEAVVFDGVSHVPVGAARFVGDAAAALEFGLTTDGGFRADLQGATGVVRRFEKVDADVVKDLSEFKWTLVTGGGGTGDRINVEFTASRIDSNELADALWMLGGQDPDASGYVVRVLSSGQVVHSWSTSGDADPLPTEEVAFSFLTAEECGIPILGGLLSSPMGVRVHFEFSSECTITPNVPGGQALRGEAIDIIPWAVSSDRPLLHERWEFRTTSPDEVSITTVGVETFNQ